MLKTTTRNANFGWQTEPVWRTDHMENRRFKRSPGSAHHIWRYGLYRS